MVELDLTDARRRREEVGAAEAEHRGAETIRDRRAAHTRLGTAQSRRLAWFLGDDRQDAILEALELAVAFCPPCDDPVLDTDDLTRESCGECVPCRFRAIVRVGR